MKPDRMYREEREMSRSEYLVIAILALTATATAASSIIPRTFVTDRISVQLSDAAMRHALHQKRRHTFFSMDCELGGHVVSIDYSSGTEE